MHAYSTVTAFVLAGALACASPALEAAVIWDLNNLSTPTSGTYGNVRTFLGSDSQTETRVSAFAQISTATTQLETAYLGAYGGGLGITNRGEGTGGSNSHTMDNRGRLEFMLFAFENAIIPTSITLTPYSDPNNNNYKDTDFSVWIGTVADHTTATLAGMLIGSLDTTFTRLPNSLSTTTSTRTVTNFNPNNYSGNVLIIASLIVNNDPKYDYVKVKEVKGVVVHVPTPAGAGLFLVGLAGALWGRRRTA